MAWESAAIGLLADALKKIVGHFSGNIQERRAAQLVSDATRELLLENPHIEKARANLLEAEKLLGTPSPELLHAQIFLDRVVKDYESAHHAINRMYDAYHWQGNKWGIARTSFLSGKIYLETENFQKASEAFEQAIEIFLQLGYKDRIFELLPDALEVFLHEGQINLAKELLSASFSEAFYRQDQRLKFDVLVSLGVAADNSELDRLALRAFSMIWASHPSDNLREQLKKHTTALALSEDQFNEIVSQMQEVWESDNIDRLVACLFDE